MEGMLRTCPARLNLLLQVSDRFQGPLGTRAPVSEAHLCALSGRATARQIEPVLLLKHHWGHGRNHGNRAFSNTFTNTIRKVTWHRRTKDIEWKWKCAIILQQTENYLEQHWRTSAFSHRAPPGIFRKLSALQFLSESSFSQFGRQALIALCKNCLKWTDLIENLPLLRQINAKTVGNIMKPKHINYKIITNTGHVIYRERYVRFHSQNAIYFKNNVTPASHRSVMLNITAWNGPDVFKNHYGPINWCKPPFSPVSFSSCHGATT